MRDRRAASVLVTCLFLAAALAGCARSDLGSETNQDPAVTNVPPSERGHRFATDGVTAEHASLSGVDFKASPTGETTLRFGTNVRPPSERAALVLAGAVVGGETGFLFATAPVTLNGPIGYSSTLVSLAPDAVRARVAANPDGRFAMNPSLEEEQPLHRSGFNDERLAADPLTLRLRGPVEITAERLVFVTTEGHNDLAGPVRVATARGIGATTTVDVEGAPVTVRYPVSADRGTLLLSGSNGRATLDDDQRIDLDGAVAVTLKQGTDVSLIVIDDTGDVPRIGVVASGRTYQVYANEAAVLPSRLTLSIAAVSVPVEANGTRKVKFTVANGDPHTDAVITGVDVTGAPDKAVRMPGFESITQAAFAAFADDPVALTVVAAVSPALVLADVFAFIIDAVFGPPAVPQVIEAGATFTTELRLTRPHDNAGYEAAVAFAGNFDTTSATVAVTAE